MRAIVLEKFGGLDSLVYKDIPEPEPKAGHVVIQIKAFGINHAEMHMRRGEWAEAAEVSGIECVGLVKSCPGGEFPVGARVATLMGGLGRTIDGSYAEYTRAPASNVALIESDLPWAELAAIPETYATAWTCPFRNLEIEKGQLLVIRGARSSFGQAALKMAVNAGVRVIATTRNRDRFSKLEKLGAERCEIEQRDLSKHIAEAKKIDAVLDLVGNSVMLDSLAMLRRGGRSCLAGWLGGLDPIPDFNPLLQMASGVYLTFFGSFVFGTPGFPLSDVPLQKIAGDAAGGCRVAPPRLELTANDYSGFPRMSQTLITHFRHRQAKNALNSKFHRLRLGIERKQLLRMCDAAQRIASHRNEATLNVSHVGERRRHQNGLIDRTAHRGNAVCLVHRRTNDGEVQPLAAADVAIEYLADMQTEIHVGYRPAVGRPAPIQFFDALARGDRRG